ncbi:MAG: lysyl-tRNA synthetase class 2 [Gammaproteobacteria bacterium]|jgi:lysyl-tRNA synthetase class 2
MSESWQPSASLDIIRQRAELLKLIRRFMDERNIMEVETPILSRSGNTDPNLVSLHTQRLDIDNNNSPPLYLNTSPEFAMKRLLASGSGSIYQITKVFRDGELGCYHEPEFTMIEWYRTGFDHHALMDESGKFLLQLGFEKSERYNYAEVFESITGLNPHTAETKKLYDTAVDNGLHQSKSNRRSLLDFLFSHCITPELKGKNPIFIYDFPVCQAALARIRNDDPPVAERFELFIDGLEIANGFHELCDAKEQLTRFQDENMMRINQGSYEMPIDHNLIEALKQGLPDCAGIAMGFDRLLMKTTGMDFISNVMVFGHDRC